MAKYVKILVPDDFDNSHAGEYPVFEPKYINVLDHGFVGLIDFMGDDSAIVNGARVSYGKGTKKVNTDRGLIRYLMRHSHSSPFELCSFKFHVKAPIFVFRQWHRHRVASLNENSARYSILDSDMYHPDLEHLQPQSTNNRQGRSDNILTNQEYDAVTSAVDHVFDTSYQTYIHLLGPNENGDLPSPADAIRARIDWCKDAAVTAVKEARLRAKSVSAPDPYPTEESVLEAIQTYMTQNGVSELDNDFPGIARELARIVLPVATYSQMYWKCNLHNIFHFLKLRCDSHAQYEIRVYANAMLELIEPFVPWATEAFRDYSLNGASLSKMEVESVRELLGDLSRFLDDYTEGADVHTIIRDTLASKGASQREIEEFIKKFES